MSLVQRANQRAANLGVPLSAQVDLTWRCNERCVHCYLDHDGEGEMSFADVADLLDQLAAAGVFFLSLSGGEIFLRPDLFEILARARKLGFDIKLRTNGMLIGEQEARRIREFGVRQTQISLYSHRPEEHDAITKVRGSHARTVESIRRLRSLGLEVIVACVVMRSNRHDYSGVRDLAASLGAKFTIDPTITPHINGDRSLLRLNIGREDLFRIFHDTSIAGPIPDGGPPAVDEEALDASPCSAGNTACYISPRGDVFPCVQFPLPCGNIREQPFAEIWRDSAALREVQSIRVRDLPECSRCAHGGSCSRCPGLAYMEGNMRGPSLADCEKSHARTGIASRALASRLVALQPSPSPSTCCA